MSDRAPDGHRIALCALALVLAAGMLPASVVAGPPEVLPSVGNLFRRPLTEYANINPAGDLVSVAYNTRQGHGLRAYRVETGETREIPEASTCHRLPCEIESVDWIDDDLMLVGRIAKRKNPNWFSRLDYLVVDFSVGERRLDHAASAIKSIGRIIDPLPQQPRRVLFVPASAPGSVYRVDPMQLHRGPSGWRERLTLGGKGSPTLVASFEEEVFRWIPDAKGEIRLVVTVVSDPLRLNYWYRASASAEWKLIRTESEQRRFDRFTPLGFTRDGTKVLVASSIQRDRYGLYEYDPANNRIESLIYEHPTAELVGIQHDYYDGEVIAAIYIENGETRYAYLGQRDPELTSAIEAGFKNQLVSLTGLSRDRRRATLMVTRDDDPGAFWLLDLESGGASELGRIRPNLDDKRLAPSESFLVESADGLEIEAFLTHALVGDGPPPLVVMPHGGPIGVADVRVFNPEIQYLARMGFSVLRVNYRGSGARGRGFSESGRRQWGRRIEDDIEAAIDHVVAQGVVDRDRICTMGASYGGYSALMLAVRRPDAYRCAASLAGVTDIAHLFNADDLWGGEIVTKAMSEIVGDPDEDYAEQKAYSPTYNADKIKIPVLLAHGDYDRRVDRDQMIRMKLALEIEGASVQTISIRNMGHSFSSRDAAIEYWKMLRKFLAEHLQPATSP